VSKSRPRYFGILRPSARRSQRFCGRHEFRGDGGRKLERVAQLVVGDRCVEGVEEVCELDGAAAPHP
jgi:hypothetical protein